MDRYALVVDGLVTNIIIWDGIASPERPDWPGGTPIKETEETGAASVGGTFDGTTFTRAEEPA